MRTTTAPAAPDIHAVMDVCPYCWSGLDRVDRRIYLRLDIFGRAMWVLLNKPQEALAL